MIHQPDFYVTYGEEGLIQGHILNVLNADQLQLGLQKIADAQSDKSRTILVMMGGDGGLQNCIRVLLQNGKINLDLL